MTALELPNRLRGATIALWLGLLSAGAPASAAEPTGIPAPGGAETRRDRADVDDALGSDTPGGWFELTFGTAHGYPARLIGDYDDDIYLTSTGSVLVMVEYAPLWWVRVVFLYDLITGPEETIRSGVVHNEELPSRIAAGVGLAVYHLDFAKRSRLELEGFFLMGLTVDSDPEPVPILMGRMTLMQSRDEGVGVYVGVAYYAVIDKLSLLYGVGYRF
ncbi:MAG: hypothetical protein IV100_30635 [Myxococcales bacterium]|nr:hypothetical protein [Myxococcales bacterium]